MNSTNGCGSQCWATAGLVPMGENQRTVDIRHVSATFLCPCEGTDTFPLKPIQLSTLGLYFLSTLSTLLCLGLSEPKSLFVSIYLMLLGGRSHIGHQVCLQVNKQWIRILTLLYRHQIFTFGTQRHWKNTGMDFVQNQLTLFNQLVFCSHLLYLSMEQAFPHHLVISKH